MLPTKKLFKTIDCPFYDATKSESCARPYCHFNHPKPEPVEKIEASAPVYIPTPKYILEARKAQSASESDTEPVTKKPKLEYVPAAKTNTKYPIPTYIPTVLNATDAIDKSNIEQNDINGDDIAGLLNELAAEQPSDNENHSENVPKLDSDTVEKPKSSSKHRHHSSSSSSHKSSSRSHSSSHSKSSSSKSSSSHKHSSSSSSSKKSTHSDKSKDSSRHSDKSSSERKNRSERKSSSSSSSSSRHRSIHSKSRNSDSKKKDESIEKSILCELDSEEDDVEAQCRLIFDEYEPEEKSSDELNGLTQKPNETEDNDHNDDTVKKKRVAHENADKQSNPLVPFKKSVNHVQSAMQSVFMRQEIMRKQQEEKEEKARRDIEQREAALEERRKSFEAEKAKLNLTPLIAPAALVPPPRFGPKSFSPVSNMLAIQRAKEKVQQLKAQKLAQHQQFLPKPTVKALPPKTVAQTAARGTGRVAHATTTPTVSKPAPPVLEPTSTKISYNVRMQYYNMMVKHCLTIYDECTDAWERAQTEELAVFKKCNTIVIYKSSALLAVNKLRKESLDAGNVNTEKNKVISHDLILVGKHGQNTSWNVNRKLNSDGPTNLIDTCSSSKAYDMIAELRMTDEQLRENGYPRCGDKAGIAKIYHHRHSATPINECERYCRRCGTAFNLDEYDEECIDRCNYHPKSPGFRRGFADNSHRCCQQPAGSPGCMYANYHVTDYLDPNNLTGFIKTIACDDDYVPSRKDIFALDCEMCYTTIGLELTRVTVVDINRKTVYDALVKPDNKIIDYNTIYSGISEKTLANVTRSLRDVQAVLLSMFNSKTILIGHSLESDFKALKLIHDMVVDTSILFPHKMGPPKKRALKTLCIENLKRIIQEDEGGHNSAEDAEVCIDLVKHYLRNRIK